VVGADQFVAATLVREPRNSEPVLHVVEEESGSRVITLTCSRHVSARYHFVLIVAATPAEIRPAAGGVGGGQDFGAADLVHGVAGELFELVSRMAGEVGRSAWPSRSVARFRRLSSAITKVSVGPASR
jgi:hypothetical protein